MNKKCVVYELVFYIKMWVILVYNIKVVLVLIKINRKVLIVSYLICWYVF